jgi:hypothetical protein
LAASLLKDSGVLRNRKIPPTISSKPFRNFRETPSSKR